MSGLEHKLSKMSKQEGYMAVKLLELRFTLIRPYCERSLSDLKRDSRVQQSWRKRQWEKGAKNVRLGQQERERVEEKGWATYALPGREGRAETFSRSTQCLLDTIDPASTETGSQARRNTVSHTDQQLSCRLNNQLINSDHLYAARQFMHFVKVWKKGV